MALKKYFRVEGSSEGTVKEAKEFLQRPCTQIVSWDTYITWAVRFLYIVITVMIFIHRELLQIWVNQLWGYLLTSWIFNCVYFETWWTVISYIVAFLFPWLMNQFGCFKKYRINPSMKWKSYSLVFYLKETVFYVTPLMILDTFLVKKYYNVDPREWELRRQLWIQHTRALPRDPPSLAGIIGCIVSAFLVYDLVFFFVHFCVHKNAWLYKHVHADHHNHPHFQIEVTNQLSLFERITLVLSANESLKIFNSHPLTRAIFVPLFVGWLIENHSGFDVPWTLDKIIPLGLVGGSRAHFRHHCHGNRNYQPFFTYIDSFILNPRGSETESLHKK